MANQLPSGRWRTRVRHPHTGKQINTRNVIGGPVTYATERMACAAEDEARRVLASGEALGMTVGDWWQIWTTDQRWQRPAGSTNLHNRERTTKFVAAHADLPMRAIGDAHVAAWLRGGDNDGTVPALRVFFNDAMTGVAGRLVERNPFARLGFKKSRGRRDTKPPTQEQMEQIIATAEALKTPPSFVAYIDVGAHEGMRSGELDGLRWSKIDFQTGTIVVDEQWNVKMQEFGPPKHGSARSIALTDPARQRLERLPRDSEFVFTNLRGSHYTPSSRTHHWNRIRCTLGLGNLDLYTATRHYFGWYAWNVLELTDRDIALHLGHSDGGKLVRELYGHADEDLARDRVREAFRNAPPRPTPLRRVL